MRTVYDMVITVTEDDRWMTSGEIATRVLTQFNYSLEGGSMHRAIRKATTNRVLERKKKNWGGGYLYRNYDPNRKEKTHAVPDRV